MSEAVDCRKKESQGRRQHVLVMKRDKQAKGKSDLVRSSTG